MSLLSHSYPYQYSPHVVDPLWENVANATQNTTNTAQNVTPQNGTAQNDTNAQHTPQNVAAQNSEKKIVRKIDGKLAAVP